uniref:Uncharacterized protein n=1 Tax=Cannabis sativa TaxID=3483 RepID=A0A803NN14_CANSA
MATKNSRFSVHIYRDPFSHNHAVDPHSTVKTRTPKKTLLDPWDDTSHDTFFDLMFLSWLGEPWCLLLAEEQCRQLSSTTSGEMLVIHPSIVGMFEASWMPGFILWINARHGGQVVKLRPLDLTVKMGFNKVVFTLVTCWIFYRGRQMQLCKTTCATRGWEYLGIGSTVLHLENKVKVGWPVMIYPGIGGLM